MRVIERERLVKYICTFAVCVVRLGLQAGLSLQECRWSAAAGLALIGLHAHVCAVHSRRCACMSCVQGIQFSPFGQAAGRPIGCKQGAPSGCSAGERSGARMQAHECLRLFEAVRALTPGKNSPKVLETPIWASHLACQPDPCSTNALLGSGGWVEPAGRWRGGCKRPRETREACATAFVCMLRLLPARSSSLRSRSRTRTHACTIICTQSAHRYGMHTMQVVPVIRHVGSVWFHGASDFQATLSKLGLVAHATNDAP